MNKKAQKDKKLATITRVSSRISPFCRLTNESGADLAKRGLILNTQSGRDRAHIAR